MMAMRCTICNHPDKLAIEKKTLRGVPYTKIGIKYGVNHQTVRSHHLNDHISKQHLKAFEVMQLEESQDLLQTVVEDIKWLAKLARKAEKQNKLGVAIRGVAERRNSFDFLARIWMYVSEERKYDQVRRALDIVMGPDCDFGVLTDGELENFLTLTEKLKQSGADNMTTPELQDLSALLQKVSTVELKANTIDKDEEKDLEVTPPKKMVRTTTPPEPVIEEETKVEQAVEPEPEEEPVVETPPEEKWRPGVPVSLIHFESGGALYGHLKGRRRKRN